MTNIDELVEVFFKEYSALDELHSCALVLCRQDGIPLYSLLSEDSDLDVDTAGALVSGVWQASSVLSQFMPENEDDDYRFNYSTSSKGIYIDKVKTDYEELYLSLIYFNLDNPAKLKSRVRMITSKLVDFINTHAESVSDTENVFLFDDISDNEVDNLFSTVIG